MSGFLPCASALKYYPAPALRVLLRPAGVLDVEPNYPARLAKLANDPLYFNTATGAFTPYQAYLRTMGADWAWNLTQGGGGRSKRRRLTVCTIDSGVDVSHPDLAPNLASPPGISVLGMADGQWAALKRNSSWYLGVSAAREPPAQQAGHGSMPCCGAAGQKPALAPPRAQ